MPTPRKNNSLNANDRTRIFGWFQENIEEIKRKELTTDEVARWAGNVFDLHVSPHTIANMFSNRKGALVPFTWPRSKTQSNRGVRQGQLKLLFQAIEELRLSYGEPFEGELKTLWHALGEQLGVEIPVTI